MLERELKLIAPVCVWYVCVLCVCVCVCVRARESIYQDVRESQFVMCVICNSVSVKRSEGWGKYIY
jgi:hypothetical protein